MDIQTSNISLVTANLFEFTRPVAENREVIWPMVHQKEILP